ncbi:GEVED domain-containing protein [Microscilla marina]|uniref:MAM domain protein n=1 Tax=Microscilla marina ATCC 23134 TaxID=313606 RepID=A1ZU65_MICM2|nr:GEVED domain-containing protein [Microscilla marina]EAY26036.1 MAM domain protein [Microscilla marina ATCC 23134]
MNRIITSNWVYTLLVLGMFVLVPGVNAQQKKVKREGNPAVKAAYELNLLKDPKTGKIPENIRTKELTYVLSTPSLKKSDKNQRVTAANWNRRGPYNVGGRTRALAIDRSNENVILAGGVSGGMWRSTNGGASWTQTTGASQLKSVTDVYQDPNNTNIWYYVTGEIVGNSASGGGAAFRGNGVFKSTDGGLTWVSLAATSADPTVFTGGLQYSLRVRVDPTNSDVYVAAFDGIYRSTNGGTSFTNVLSAPDARYTDLEISATGVIYATIGSNSTSTNKGVFKSTNGTSWSNITPSLAAGYQRIVLDVAPSNENIVYVFANTPGAGTNDHQVFYSSNAGSSWTNRSSNLPAYGGSVGNLSQGSYNQYLKIKPDNPNVVFIGSTNLYRTTNGFTSTGGNTWVGGYSPANNVSTYDNHHPDNHSLVFYPSNPARMLTGHDGGISRTENNLANSAGTFPVSWTSLSNGYYTTQIYGIAIDPETANDSRLMVGLQDNGKWTATSFSGTSNWGEERAGGDGCYVAIVAGQDIRYTSTQNGNILRFEGPNIENPSDADGIQPSSATNQMFVNPFILDKADQNIMYYPAGNRIWRNTNLSAINSGYTFSGTNTGWTNLTGSDAGLTAAELENRQAISALDVSKNNAAHVLYYGTSTGKLFRLDNAHTGNPSKVDIYTGKGFPADAYVSGIAVDPNNSNNVVVVFSNYQVKSVFYSTNAGSSWTDISGNLEQNSDGSGNGPSVRWAEIHRDSNGGTVYLVGTSTGLYSTETLNGTATTWTQEGPNTIGNVPVVMIEGRSVDNLVAVGTHGVGAFSATVTAAAPACGTPSSLASSNVAQTTATLNWGAVSGANNYDVRYRVQGTSTWTNVNGVSGTSTNLSGLTGSTNYEAQVRANCSAGASNYSGSTTFTTSATPAACITTFPYSESFETGLGGWIQSSSDDADFTRLSGATGSSDTGPASANDGSFYVYVEASNPNFPSKTATLISPCFDLSATNNPTFTFDYHMYGSQVNNLKAEVSTNEGASWTQIFTKSGNQGNNWFNESIDVNAYKGANVSFRFTVTTGANASNGWQSDIAIDNIKVETGSTGGGSCVSSITTFPYIESFEAGLGDWSQSTGDNINWTRQSGTTPSSSTGPSGASDGAFYLFTEASGDGTGFPGKIAILNGPCFNVAALTNPEFRFDYNMNGAAMGSLELQASTDGGATWNTIFTKSGNQGSTWLTATVDFSAYSSGDVKVRFVGATGTNYTSDISIDNIILQGSTSTGGGGAPTGYCASSGTRVNYEWIDRVQIGTIDNQSGANAGGYGDYTAQSTDLVTGNSVNITLTPGWAGTQYNEGFTVWIDYNRDGDFADAGERVFTTSSASTISLVSGSITVPSSAQAGLTRMRVSMEYNSVPNDPCATIGDGEVEDYIVNIVPGSSAAGINSKAATTVVNTTYNPEGIKQVYATSFPNPTTRFTTVKVQAAIGTNVKMLMTDVNGVGLISRDRTSETGVVEEEFDISKFSKGLYIIKVWTVNGNKTLKIMKQ